MHSAQTVIRVTDPPAALAATRTNFAAYGLGWSLREYRGHKVVGHGGSLAGMVSSVWLVPEEKLGIVVLTNQEESGALSAVGYRVLDHYLQVPPSDWVAAYQAVRREKLAKAAAAEKKQAEARSRNTRAALDLARYAGEYADAWYGRAIIRMDGGKLVLSFSHTPAMVAELEHWQYDTFVARWRDRTVPDAFVTFTLNREGAVEHFKMAAVSTLADFSFDYQDLLFTPLKTPSSPAL